MNKLWLTRFIVLAVSVPGNFGGNITDSTETTLNYVNTLRGRLELTNNPNIILVIGITGVGKSTLLHCIATDCSRILSIENEVEYSIIDELDDEAGNITSTSVSRTLLPKSIVDSTQNVWYDCPGFGDTRNETVEIATAYLTKCVIENAKGVKIVLVVDFDSITRGHNRDGFDRLLSRTTQLIKNTENYENSFSLVITKVPPYNRRKEILDTAIKKSAAAFMRDHRATLQEKGWNEQKICLIDALLGQSASYPRISIFWRPDDQGYFNTIPKMMTGRQRIRESIIAHSSYTEIQKNDFGFPLTGDAMNKIAKMTDETINEISIILQSINQRMQQELRQKIHSAPSYQQKLELTKIGKQIIQDSLEIRRSSEQMTMKKLIVVLNALRTRLQLNSIDELEFNQIEEYEHNLSMLQSLVEAGNLSFDHDGNLYLSNLEDFFNDFENQFQLDITNEVRQRIDNVSSILTNVDGRCFDAIKHKIDSMHGYQRKWDELKLAKMLTTSNTSLNGKTQEFRNLIEAFNISNSSLNDLSLIERHEVVLLELKLIAKTDIILPVLDWIAASSRTTNFIASGFKWYSSLGTIYEFLASYEVQRNTMAYNVANLADWALVNKPQGLTIDRNNFDEFVQRFPSLSEFEPIESKLIEINEILMATLKSPVKYECVGKTMVIKGNFVKSSDIQLTRCPLNTALMKISVFAVNTFYADADLNLIEYTDIELHIFSTTFYVQQAATFYLNGKNGEGQSPPKSNGTPGKPGQLGMNSGNFFALANRIHNGELLTVQQIAGNGGAGQSGSGNADYSVTFDDSDDKHTNAGFPDVEKYQEERIDKKSYGHRDVSFQINDQTMSYYALIAAGSSFFSMFSVTASQCCGSTGIGGPGNVK